MAILSTPHPPPAPAHQNQVVPAPEAGSATRRPNSAQETDTKSQSAAIGQSGVVDQVLSYFTLDGVHKVVAIFTAASGGKQAIATRRADICSCQPPITSAAHHASAAALEAARRRNDGLAVAATAYRYEFLHGGTKFEAPPMHKTVEVSLPMSSAPVGGLWVGKYYDGYVWQEANWTIFFEDIAPTVKNVIVSKGSYLDVMGTFSEGSSETKIAGEYCPSNGRVAWAQRKPQKGVAGGKGTWEVWGCLYSTPMDVTNGEVAAADQVQEEHHQVRLLATWQDEKGGKGNMELCLVSGNPGDVRFAVADSFWSALGSQPFVQPNSGEGEEADLSKDWVILPTPGGEPLARMDRM